MRQNSDKPLPKHFTDPMLYVKASYAWVKRQRGTSFSHSAYAAQYEVNKGLLYHVLHKTGYFSTEVASAFMGEEWGSVRLVFPTGQIDRFDKQDYPPYIVLTYSPRQCPVTDQWFIPPTPHTKYLPGLSAAVKRMARRDLGRARERYRTEGDWGQE